MCIRWVLHTTMHTTRASLGQWSNGAAAGQCVGGSGVWLVRDARLAGWRGWAWVEAGRGLPLSKRLGGGAASAAPGAVRAREVPKILPTENPRASWTGRMRAAAASA